MVLDKYGYLHTSVMVRQAPPIKEPEETVPSVKLRPDAKDITLAQYDRTTKDLITAHRISDYRRKKFELLLLPPVEILFDRLLEGSDYFNALLHNESPYS